MKRKPQKKRIKHEIRSDYLNSIYEIKDFTKKINYIVKELKVIRRKNPFDAIAIRGVSGMAVGFPISLLLKIPLINVRKPGLSHYLDEVEGTISSKRYLIIDDFIESGNTINHIRKVIRSNLGTKTKAVGIFLYAANREDIQDDRDGVYRKLPIYTLKDVE